MKYTKLKKEFINYFVYKSGEKKGFIDTSFDLVWKWITKNFVAKQPKQKLIGEKTSSKILDSGTHQPISKPKSKVNPKTCNHQWKQQGEGPNCYCEKCHSLLVKKGNRPTLQPIEKIPIRIKEQTETTILVNQWDLAHKVNQIIDRINLLSIKNKL
jgi:hypothetical protein